MAPYLLSRTLDPILGVFTGVLAYYLHETHPRTAVPEGSRLIDLIRWRINFKGIPAGVPQDREVVLSELEQMKKDSAQMKRDVSEPGNPL